MSTRSLAPDLAVRAPTLEDVEAAYALDQPCSTLEYGTPEAPFADFIAHWRLPGTDLARDTWLVMNTTGEITGYARVIVFAQTRFYSYLLVHPNYRQRAVGELLLERIEERARRGALPADAARRRFRLPARRAARGRRRPDQF